LGNGLVDFSAVLLNGGKVLFSGGSDNTFAWPNPRVYDPATGAFTSQGPLSVQYWDFPTSTLLNNGMVLIAGGLQACCTAPILANTNLYDPATGAFTPGSTMHAARNANTATLLADGSGKVLIAGGDNGYSAELFPPDTLTPPNLTSIAVTPGTSSQTIVVGGKQRFIATGTFNINNVNTLQQLASVTWRSSDASVVQVSNDVTNSGLARALSPGTAAITACAGAICSLSTTLTVGTVQSIVVTPSGSSVLAGTTQQFTGTGNLLGGGQVDVTHFVSWSSSDTSLAAISTTGLATGLAAGSPTITASITGVTPASVTLSVTPNTLISIALTPSSPSILFSTSVQFIAIGTYSGGYSVNLTNSVTWSSSSMIVATVNTSGLVTGLFSGGATITATFGSVSGSGSVTVSAPLTSVAVTPLLGYVSAGGYLQFTATGTYADGSTQNLTNSASIAWFSSDTAIAAISASGLASGLNVGSCNISAAVGATSSNSTTLNVYGSAGFVATGSMSTARDIYTSTLLQNGKVLITGGNGAGASAELYDPSTGTFSATGSMSRPRLYQAATLLQNGKVLITGGEDTSTFTDLASAELYDPATGTFSLTGNMTDSRISHTATLLQSGQVLVAGGQDAAGAYLNSAELYDPVAGTFNPTNSPMNTARSGATANLLNTGKVLITGGAQAYGQFLASAELYDPAVGTFTNTSLAMGTARISHTATLLQDGKVLVTGGQVFQTYYPFAHTYFSSAEVYDPGTDTFSPTTGSMNTARSFHAATLLNNGKVVVTGGYGNTGVLASAELYDPNLGTFSPTGSMNAARQFITGILLNNGQVLVTGGNSGGASAELYLP
jgi:hypothetical protein